MTPSEITNIIEKEINGNWSRSNAHCVDLRKCLIIPPVKQDFEDCPDNKIVKLWLVLEEVPDDKSGYKIVFDENTKMFGLATPGFRGIPAVIGYTDTFLRALDIM